MYASVLFDLLGVCLSKTSLLLLVYRLSAEAFHRRALQAAIWTTLAALVS